MRSWRLQGVGLSFLKSGGEVYSEHPDSKIKLNQFKIPFGAQIEEEVTKAAKLFDKDFIGFDVAITPNGPTIIEGNHNPHLIMLQMAVGGIKNHPRYSEIFSEYI